MEAVLVKELLSSGIASHQLSREEAWKLAREIFQLFGEIVYPHDKRLYVISRAARERILRCVNELEQGRCVERREILALSEAIREQIGIVVRADYFLERLIEKDLVWTRDGRLTGCAVYSELTGGYYWRDDPDLVWVVFDRGQEEPCLEYELGEYAFWCNYNRRWYSREIYEDVVVEGETFLLSSVEDSIFLWSDGEFHWEPEFGLGLSDYHCGFRPEPLGGPRLSFELEVEVGFRDPSFGEAVRDVWDAAEKDSSLGNWGAELIVGFIPLEAVDRLLASIVKVLNRFDCRVPDDQYGFHVSASISGWGLSERQVDKLAKAFYGHRDLVCRVARRQPNRYCRWEYSQLFGCPENKYRALRQDEDRLEFRIFKASTDYLELRQSALLVEAFLKFALSAADNLDEFLRDNFPEFVS